MRKIVNAITQCFIACSRPISSVAGAALLLAIAGFISRLFGLARDRILASTFGAGDILDVYYASFRIPDLIYGLLVLGALSAAFIPVFTRVYNKDSTKKAWQLTSSFLSLLLVGVAGFSLVVVILMPHLVYLIAPGFEGEKREMVIWFTRVMLLSPILLGASAVFGGVLVSRKSFLAYAIAPIFYNIGIIFGVLFLVDWVGAIGLAWGVIVGAFFHFLLQYIAVKQSGYHFTFPRTWPWKNKDIRKIFFLMGPQVLSTASNQIQFWIITLFASILASGSLTVFTFANNIQSIPLALIGISFAVAAFPKMSHAVSEDDMKEFVRIFLRTVRRILYFVIPVAVFFILLRAQIVRVVLGGGVFDWDDTILTYQVLTILSISLFAQSLIPLMARAFYSLEDTKTPFFIAIFSQFIHIIVILFTLEPFGIYALAGAFSFASIVQVMLMSLALRKRIGKFEAPRKRMSLPRILVATLIAGVSIQAIKLFWGNVTDLDTFWEVFIQLVLAGGVGMGVYLLVSHWLQIEEFCDFRRKVYTKLFEKPKTIAQSQEPQDIENL
jgi:putative peptidoglycan lipid II flippase